MMLAALCGVALLWTYAPALLEMAERWKTDPRYSHGFLVPLFSAFLLWHRRDMLKSGGACCWWPPAWGWSWAASATISAGSRAPR
jgi:hypothetical protein